MGFKPRHSCSHALFVLNETVDYFTRHGSTVFVTFLDCSKAFDKVPHKVLYSKLIERGVPLCFINLLIYWLSNLSSRVRWQSAFSDSFTITSGVKQGGILSPNLFTVFVDDLISLLKKSGMGCQIESLYVGSIMYADDLTLLAPTRSAMQKMIRICEKYCDDHSLSFNPKKTKSMLFGNGYESHKPINLSLYNDTIQYVTEWRYLGCLVKSGKEFSLSCKSDIAAFRRSANSVLSAINKLNEQVAMRLLYSFSVPILTYAAEIKQFSYSDMNECNVALNDAIRRIFSYNRWESIRTLRQQLGYKDLYSIFAIRRRNFFQNFRQLRNRTIVTLWKHSST